MVPWPLWERTDGGSDPICSSEEWKDWSSGSGSTASCASHRSPRRHDWHLAPLSMKWQDLKDKTLTSAEVCKAVTDRSKNNNLDGAGLLNHHAEEPLVLWALHNSPK